MKYLSKDKNEFNNVNYWFELANGDTLGVNDRDGKLTALDCDGMPIDYNDYLRDKVLSECVITEEMKAE